MPDRSDQQTVIPLAASVTGLEDQLGDVLSRVYAALARLEGAVISAQPSLPRCATLAGSEVGQWVRLDHKRLQRALGDNANIDAAIAAVKAAMHRGTEKLTGLGSGP